MRNHNQQQSTASAILLNSALAGILALGIGTGSAYASGDAAGVTEPTSSTTSTAANVSVNADSEEKPSLLPGDFFYFIKSIYENIRLAVTVNDVKEAKLLAELAQERLAEAKALLEKGEQEKAEELLQKSIDTQVKAVVIIDSEFPTEGNGDDEAPEVQLNEQAVKVKTDLQHNIAAITAALEKVENPNAQEALLKNIEKAFGHLEKKLSKLESKNERNAEKSATAAPEATAATSPVPTAAPAPSLVQDQESSVVIEANAAIDATMELLTDSKPEKAEKAEKAGKPVNAQKESKSKEPKSDKAEYNRKEQGQQNGKDYEKNHSGK